MVIWKYPVRLDPTPIALAIVAKPIWQFPVRTFFVFVRPPKQIPRVFRYRTVSSKRSQTECILTVWSQSRCWGRGGCCCSWSRNGNYSTRMYCSLWSCTPYQTEPKRIITLTHSRRIYSLLIIVYKHAKNIECCVCVKHNICVLMLCEKGIYHTRHLQSF